MLPVKNVILVSDDCRIRKFCEETLPCSTVRLYCCSGAGDVPCTHRKTPAVLVLIDFSVKNALSEILNYALKVKVPVVLCTTGYDSEDVKLIKKASSSIPVFRSGNMSLGVNLLLELVKKATSVIPNSDIEITETHHNQKVDAPSGTAVMIADAVNSALEIPRPVICGREGMVGKRGTEIGMHSLRGGTVVGKHSVSFFLNDEVITLTHEAESKQVFAEGAVKAAAFMVGKSAGLYNMGDVLN